MMSQISGPCCDSEIKPDQFESLVWESHVRQKIFVVFEDMLSLKKTKSSLVSIINILIIINACQDSVKHGKYCTDEWFYFLCGIIILWVKLCENVWSREQGFIAVHETVHLVKFIGKGCSIFFFWELMLHYLVPQDIKYSSMRPGFIWSTWPRNNRTNLHNFRSVLMLVCFSP